MNQGGRSQKSGEGTTLVFKGPLAKAKHKLKRDDIITKEHKNERSEGSGPASNNVAPTRSKGATPTKPCNWRDAG